MRNVPDKDAMIEELAMLVKRLCVALNKADNHPELAWRATLFLDSHDLMGEPTRTANSKPLKQETEYAQTDH